ncbi:MAG: hypothetical protein EOM22_18570 [Gammaproteobacteria bacterium]|nr:hypothetical protein [Gammaproteobacteria bacterium]
MGCAWRGRRLLAVQAANLRLETITAGLRPPQTINRIDTPISYTYGLIRSCFGLLSTREAPMPRFTKGTSGNPRGRPPGVANQKKLRDAIAKDLPGIITTLVEAARGGDVQAARTLLAKALPDLRPLDQPIQLAVTDASDLATLGKSVIEGVATGDLTPIQAREVLAGVGSLARVIETDELIRRIEALEEASTRGNRA